VTKTSLSVTGVDELSLEEQEVKNTAEKAKRQSNFFMLLFFVLMWCKILLFSSK
jgi:hypothetical protein